MQTREKILAGALAGVLGVWGGLPALESAFLEPLKSLESQEESLAQSVDTKSKQRLQLAKSDNDLKQWRSQSLPPDPLLAQQLYQQWVIDIAQMSGLSVTKYNPDRRVPVSDPKHGTTYFTIPVTFEAKGTLQQLAHFVERFQAIDLLHRISRCDVISSASEGNPKLDLTITAEGISMRTAPERTRLFPEALVWGKMLRDTKEVEVQAAEGFPNEAPFLVRVNDELINVTEIGDDTWTLQRGVERTFASEHGENPFLELFPLRPEDSEQAAATQNMWSQSLFTKPAPQVDYNPKLASTTPPLALQGRRWTWKMEVTSWNPANGLPLFQLLDAPNGMQVDERTGTLTWDVNHETPLGLHPIEAIVWGEGNRNAGFTSVLNVRVREPNQPPEFTRPENVKFYLGRESRVKLQATDPDDESEVLTYRLEDAPEGMTINAATGEVRWAPPEEMETQSIAFKVIAKDSDEFPEESTLQLQAAIEEDSAKYAFLTACIDFPDGKEAWIHDRATNTRVTLHEGDRAQIADIAMQVTTIGADFILVRSEDDVYRLDFEKPVSQMSFVAKVPTETPMTAPTDTESSPAETTTDATPSTPADNATSTETPPSSAPKTDEPSADQADTNPPVEATTSTPTEAESEVTSASQSAEE